MKPRPEPGFRCESGAGNETRTRDPNLGKVVLYQLSYSRDKTHYSILLVGPVNTR